MAVLQAQLEPLEITNLRNHIEQRIMTAILDGTYMPGERLVESAIAEMLGVSRAPVREALSALQRLGIVVQIPRRGYSVIDFCDRDVKEIYDLRLLLEIGALERAIERISDHDLQTMQNMVDELGRALRTPGNPERIVELDWQFHQYLCTVADHSRLYSAWNRLRLQTILLIGLTSRTHYPNPKEPQERHQRILNAIADKDLNRAIEILTEHVVDGQERALRSLGY